MVAGLAFIVVKVVKVVKSSAVDADGVFA